MRPVFLTCASLLLIGALSGCSYLGLKNPFSNDPLTGGVNDSHSRLLDARIPSGMQRFPTHSQISSGREGLETWRGPRSAGSVALDLFNTLKENGWQLRMAERMNSRALYLYQKNDEYAAIALHPQGTLTIVEIWKSHSLPDGSVLTWSGPSEEGFNAIDGEEYAPSGNEEKPVVETWGGNSRIEEKNL